jgi:uncharacterized integral membrane protein
MIARGLTGRAKGGAERLGFWWTFVAALLVFGALIVGIVQNGAHVRLHFLAWNLGVSLIVVVLTTALIAVFLDEVGGLIWRRRRRERLGRRGELEQLRAQQHLPDEVLSEPQPEPGAYELSTPTQRGTT